MSSGRDRPGGFGPPRNVDDQLPVRHEAEASRGAEKLRKEPIEAAHVDGASGFGQEDVRHAPAVGVPVLDQADGEGLFRSIIDAALDAVIVMDARGSVMHWNHQAEATFGWSHDEAVGRLLSSLIIPPQHRDAHARGLQRFLATGQGSVLNRRIELSALRRDGSEFPVELTVTPFLQGGTLAFTGFVRDITERRSAEALQARQTSEARLLYEATRLAAESASFDDALKSSLDLICRMTGWPVGHVYVPDETGCELVTTGIWHLDDAVRFARFRKVTEHTRFARGIGLPGRVWASGAPEWFERLSTNKAFLRKTRRSDLGVETAFAFPVKTDGATFAVLEFATDAVVTLDERLLLLVRSMGEQVGRLIERKRAEEALRQSERRFRDFAASASDWLWETDAEHRFVWLSPNVEARVQVPPEWHYGKTRLELMEPGTSADVIEAHRRVLDAHEPFRDFEYPRRGPLGDTWLSVSGVPLVDANGRFAGYRGTSRDITEKKRAEAHREILLAELQHRVRNSLTVVQAIASCTGASARSLPDFLERFSGRIGALTTAHELLTQAGWDGISLRDLVFKTLQPYRSASPVRIHVEADDVVLRPAVAQTLTLALHELAVNATKHGALSTPAGEVHFSARAASEAEHAVDLHWRESGGPPIPGPPADGFGLNVIRHALEYQHDGRVEFDWCSTGVACRIRLPLGATPTRAG